MKRSSKSFLALVVLAAAAFGAVAQTPPRERAPANYVSPQQRVIDAGNASCGHPNSIACQSLKAHQAKQAEAAQYCVKKSACVPVVGKTADGKYPIYKLDGDPGDLKYFSGNTAYAPNDLVGRMGYVAAADAKIKGTECDWICKNAAGQVIGLDPAYLASAKK